MGFSWWGDNPGSAQEGVRVRDIVERLRAERAEPHNKDGCATDYTVLPHGWPHEAPEQPMSVFEAHKSMQNHRRCRAEQCPRKAAAEAVLIAAGRMRPDTARER